MNGYSASAAAEKLGLNLITLERYIAAKKIPTLPSYANRWHERQGTLREFVRFCRRLRTLQKIGTRGKRPLAGVRGGRPGNLPPVPNAGSYLWFFYIAIQL